MIDKKNNIFFLYNEEPDLDKAWEDMRKRLNEKMPLKEDKQKRRSLIYYTKTTAIVFLLIISLTTNNYFRSSNVPMDATTFNTEKKKNSHDFDELQKQPVKDDPFLVNKEPGDYRLNYHKKNGLMQGNDAVNNYYWNIHTAKNKITIPLRKNDNYVNSQRGIAYLPETDIPELVVKKIIRDAGKLFTPAKIPVLSINTSLPDSSGLKSKNKRNRRIGADVGLYYSIGAPLGSIHPVANLNFTIAKNSSVSAGIGLNSAISIQGFSPKEFVYLNDTVNAVQFTVAKNKIKTTTYIDVPFSFNYKINDRFIVNAGAQVSFLQTITQSREYKTYDFQADISSVVSDKISLSGIPSAAGTVPLIPLHTYAEGYEIKKANWRFIAGINYQCKGIGFKFQYQKSFTPNYNVYDFGGANSAKKVSVFMVGVYYRIR